MAQSAYQVSSFNVVTGETTHRTIQPLPIAQRLQPATPLTKGELIEMLDSLRDDVASEQEKFERKDELDAAAANKRQELSSTIAELTQQLHTAQTELDQLNAQGSTRDQYIKFAAQAELRITSIATGVYNFLLEKISQNKYEAPYSELTALLKESVRFKVDRSGVRFLTQPSFARLHATPKDSITNARIDATREKVFSAAEKLEAVLEK